MTADWTKQMCCFSLVLFSTPPLCRLLWKPVVLQGKPSELLCSSLKVNSELLLQQHPRCIVAYWQWAALGNLEHRLLGGLYEENELNFKFKTD